MKRISLGKFQGNCLAILESIQQTSETVLIPRQGKPLIKVSPVNSASAPRLGRLEDIVKIVGDIESPL